MTSWPPGIGREVHESLDSTNAEALRRAAAGDPGPVWILARAQTAGRGRRGRPWRQAPGNLSVSLLMPVAGGPAQAALRSYVAALAVADALADLVGEPRRLTLKWPNDVLLDGEKLAGILLEKRGHALAVGIGINLAEAPAPAELEPDALPAISLAAATGCCPAPEAVLDRLAPAFDAWEQVLARHGFAPVRAAFLARAARLGEPVTARLGGEMVTGRFADIDAMGALVLDLGHAVRRIHAAEISFGAAG